MADDPKNQGTGFIGFLNSTTGLVIAVTGLVTAIGGLAFSVSRPDSPPEPRPSPSTSENKRPSPSPSVNESWPSPSPPVDNQDTLPLFTATSYCTATGAMGYGENVVPDNARSEAIYDCIANGGYPECCSRIVDISQE